MANEVCFKNLHLDRPWLLETYQKEGGYEALTRIIKENITPEQIIEEVKASGLRGRGGAGFPTGLKWSFINRAAPIDKYVVCNSDEGEPGTCKDRDSLRDNPHALIEGMIICARAVGASKGIVYVRAEYPLAVDIVTRAIEQAREAGLLGEHILGSAFDFDIEIFQGSGAFVCGEETALIKSMEGARGMPISRPPYPVESGLYGAPTVINNVKTLSTVAPIIEKGAEWFKSIGTKGSPGTTVFSVVGEVVHPGLVEIPLGVTLRTLIFDICGGIPNQKKFKAVQIGGP